jgi:prepilin-type N-terminal cleavage/methylation domain-containing protein
MRGILGVMTGTARYRPPRRGKGAAAVGFTLVELLVVIAIIGVLVALLLPTIHGAVMTARVTRAESDLRQVSIALHQYYTRHDALPPARKYCLTEKRGQFLALPQELIDDRILETFPPDAFDETQTYRYSAVGPGFVNDSPTIIKFVLPEGFPESGGAWRKFSQADGCPVRCVIWSYGPSGTPDFDVVLGFNPLDPAGWYPTNPHGIILRYYTGKDWYAVP